MTITELKHELRLNDYTYDKWSASMNCFFELCDHLNERPEDVPNEWEFKPSILGSELDNESYYFELFNNCTDAQLINLGNFLYRLTTILRDKGHSY